MSLRQRRRETLALIVASFVAASACAQPSSGAPSARARESPMKIRLIVGEQVASATLYDNATARDFATLLPLSLTLRDYDVIERVSDLPRKLSTQGAPEGMAPVAGELTHYAPWGNLAIFIKPRSYSRNLLPLGKVDEGLSILARPGPYQVRIERIEP
ncbi:MAG: hypothetical protein KJ011_01345 [Burkholderiaceae bacterium]|nr:hypothetical protein [Burkholderiaceae bacterium]